jgi:hypothetical protein
MNKVGPVLQRTIDGEVFTGFDLNGDGQADLFQKPIDHGFVSLWNDGGKKQKLTFINKNQIKHKIWEEEAEGNKWILKEDWKSYPSKDFPGFTVYEKMKRVGVHSFKTESSLRSEGDYEGPSFTDDRSSPRWLFDEAAGYIGYETESAKRIKKAKQDYEDGLWFNEYPLYEASGLVCHDQKIESFGEQENWTREMRDIIEKGSWQDLASYIEVKDCGEDFKKGPLNEALELGLSCLHYMGGQATAFAAQLVGIITNAKTLSSSSQKMNVDCSRNSVIRYLYDAPPTVATPAAKEGQNISLGRDPSIGANGYSHGQCDRGYPGIVIHPGEKGIQETVEKQTATVFHEMFHMLGYYHGGDEVDLTYMCTYACFGDYAFYSEGTRRVSSERRDSLIQNAEKYCKGEPGFTKISDKYWVDFEDLVASAKLSPKVVQSGLLQNPSTKLADDINFVFSIQNKDELTTDGLVYLMAYTEDFRIYSQRVEPFTQEFIKNGLMSTQAINAVRRSNNLDSSSELGRAQFNIVARDLENAISALEEKAEAQTDIGAASRELKASLEILWRGFCKKNKQYITEIAYCLKELDDPTH